MRKILDIDATELFEDHSIDWNYCIKNHTFTHNSQCEFIIYCAQRDQGLFEDTLAEMKEHGCTKGFIAAYKDAREQGADFALFYA